MKLRMNNKNWEEMVLNGDNWWQWPKTIMNFALHPALFTRALQPFQKCPCAT